MILKRLRINDICVDDETYKISKNTTDDKLKNSIRRYGILTPPLLLNEKNALLPVIGHNRLKLAKEINVENVDVHIIQKEDHEIYVHHALLKNYNEELGPLGKVKLCRILSDFAVSRAALNDIRINDLKIPEYIRDSDSLAGEMIKLPKVLYDYLDIKGFDYRTIRMITSFPLEIKELLSRWISDTNLKKNIFRETVEYVWDIYKRDSKIDALVNIDFASTDDHMRREDVLSSKLFELRYPEYYSRKTFFEDYRYRIEKKGFILSYPEYFEGDHIVIGLKIKKTETPEFISNRLPGLNDEELHELLKRL